MTRKETDALAEWSKGFGAKGLGRHQGDRHRRSTPASPNSSQPIAAQLIERTGAKEGDLLAFAADKPKIVHKVLGELRLKMAQGSEAARQRPNYAWVWVIELPAVRIRRGRQEMGRQHAPPVHRAAG